MSFFEDENRLLVDCEDLGSESVIYTPLVGSAYSIPALVDFSEAARERNQGIAGTALVMFEDFTSPPERNATLTIDGVVYKISNDPQDQRDGAGATFLYLRRK